MKQTLLFILLLLLFISSCKDNRKRDEAAKIENEWMGCVNNANESPVKLTLTGTTIE